MAGIKLVINDPTTRKSYQVELDQQKTALLIGRKIGEEVDITALGLPGYMVKITGGTDKDGFPMHPNVKGSVRKKVLLSGPPCFHPKVKGLRKRKTVCGNTISESIVQVNCKITKKGEKPIEEIIPSKPKESKPEATEKPKEEKTQKQEEKS
jgi:small subunit ribosomal protein S6e